MANQAPDLWNKRYASEEFVFGVEPNDFLRAHVEALRPGTVCCVGDGEGRNGVFLAGAGFEVTSVDLSSVGMAKAAGLATTAGVALTTITADLADWVDTAVGQGLWDNVVSIFCHMPSATRVLEETERDVSEGSLHTGVASVLQCIGRKP